MIVLQFVSRLPGGPTVGLLVTPQEDLGHRPHLPGLLPLEPLSLQQAAAGDLQTPQQVWPVSCGVTAPLPQSWCMQGFVCALQASLGGMRFDLKRDCTPPTIVLQLLLCLWLWAIFFGGFQLEFALCFP